MAGDLLATVKPRPVEDIGIGDRVYRIPAHPAIVWLDVLADDDLTMWNIIPGLVEEDECEEHLEELLLADGIARDDYLQIVYDTIAAASGRYWWVAMRLIGIATDPQHGDFIRGNLVLHHIDARELSLAAWLDALYAIVTQRMDANAAAKFDNLLNQPPPNSKAKLSRGHRRANFAAAMAM